MKQTIAAAVAAAAVLASALPVLADNHDHGRDQRRHAPPPRQYAYAHRYHQGQVWHGHHLVYRGGRWGYYQPHNGVNLFVNIPL